MGAFDDLISKHSGSQSSGAFDDLVQKYGNQTPQKEGWGTTLKNFGNAASSGLGQFVVDTQSGVANFLQAPSANMLSGVKSGIALFDSGLTDLINASGGEAAIHKETLEDAQRASAFAAETRAENVKNNVIARGLKFLEDDGRERKAEIKADDERVNPEQIRQQEAVSNAEGLIEKSKALLKNPLAFTNTLSESLPGIVLGLGAGRLVASRTLSAGAGAGEAAAARVAAAGGDVAAQEIAAKTAIQAVQAQATRAASTAGIASEAGISGISSRESTYTQVKQTPLAKLAESKRYQEIFDQTGNSEQAREILANEVADSTPLLSAGLTGLGTVITNKLYGGDATAKVLAGVEKPTLKAVAKDISQEGVEEVVQGVPQGFSDHTAMQIADPTKQYDLGGEIAQNFLGGIALGGAGHGSAYAKQKFNDARSGVADAIRSRYEEQLAEKLTGKTTPDLPATIEPNAPKLNEAEKALATPNSITPLDRVHEIDLRLNKLSPENGYGETFDVERNDLQQERNSIVQTFPKIKSGAPTSFSTEAGAKLDAQYALIEAGDLQTSHDENLRANPNYPAALQPRERDRASSATQIAGIVQKIDPARLGVSADAATGAPIIGADGLVESGNARSIALKRIYRVPGQKAEDYKAYLTANAAQFGLDSAQIGALEKPVLVRVRNTPVDRAEFARQANASTVARMSSVEQARADSKRLDVLDDLNPTENGDFSNSHDFIRRFLSKTPQTEHGDLIDSDGRLSSSGYARVRNAVLAKAYGDSPVILRLTESLDDNLRNVSKALLQVAPKVAQVRASIGEGNLHDADITPDLLGAVEELSRIKDKGQSVSQYLGQSGIFDDKLTPEGKELLQFLDENIRRPKQMAEFILRYTEALEAQGNPSQADIFGDNTAPTKGELLNVAKREQNVEPTTGQGRNQESEVSTGQAGVEREDTRGSQESNQGNDAATRGEGEGGFVNFPEDSGTLGIPRKEMPQIKGEARGGLISFLAARGINHETGTVKASSLKPTQAEYSPAKVDKFVETGAIGGRSVLVSSDGHVLDGHHQWLGHKERGENINVIRFDKPMKELLPVVNEFPSVKRSEEGTGTTKSVTPFEKRNNYQLPSVDSFLPKSLLEKMNGYIEKFSKEAPKIVVSDVDRARAEELLTPIIAEAETQYPIFSQKIAKLSTSDGAIGHIVGPIKKMGRSVIKLASAETNFDTEQMRDILRATVVVNQFSDAQAVLDSIYKQFDVVPRRVKNRTDATINAKDLDGEAGFLKSGYGDVLVNVMLNGVQAEIQINVPEMLAAKDAQGHKLYDIEREQPIGSKLRNEIEAAEKELYAAASASAKNRTSVKNLDSDAVIGSDNGDQSLGAFSRPDLRKKNVSPPENVTKNVPPSVSKNSQPLGKDLGTSISSPPANSVAEGKGEVKDDEEAVFKANSTAVLGLTVDALTSQVKAITDQWKNAPKSNVVESPSELPFAAPSDARGAYYKGQIYLVASNLRSQEDAQMVLFHEALGHAGLRGAFGESLTPSLRKLAIDNLSIAKAAAEWRKENSDIRGKKTEDLWLTTSVEEVLADIAGQGKPLKGFDQFLAKVQSGLRAIGLNHVADWLSKHTNAEVLRLLTAARKHIIAGNKSHVFGKDEAKAFSIDPDADKSAEAALEEISKIGDAFAYPKSESNTVEGITADIDSSINVRKLTNIRGETRYEFSMPDGSTARMMVRPFNKYGKSVYGFELDANNEMTGQADERPGKFPEEAHGKGDVWIDVSLLKEGKGYGAKLYQIAANYAHNTDQVFIGDPAGISHEALIRRPEQMLSSALKFGTTEHLAPHPMQIKGDKKNGIAPLDWVYGDHIGNIQKLIDANLQNIDNGGGIGGIEYDKRTGEFIDGAGAGITRQDLFGLAKAGLARSVQAGGRTLARYAFLKSTLPAHRVGEQARRESGALLVRLSQQLRDHVSTVAQNVGADPEGKRIFYSRGRDDRTGDLFGVPDSDRANLVERASANGPERESTRTTFLRANSGNLPGDYGTVVENRIGKIEKVGVDRVNSAADAANVTASLTDLAREHLDILVTGKNGKVLAIQRMFAGSKSASAVYPEEIIAFVNSIPDAESYWASHNHPGGKHDLSLADNHLTGEIQRLSDGIAPEFKGLLALTKSKFSHTVDGKSSTDGDIPVLPKNKKVSYVEQSFVKSDKLGEAISSPSKARNIVASVSKGRSGIVLADVQNAPVAFFPLDFAIAGKLKGTPIARDILASVARSNASSAFLVTGEKIHQNETRNVGTLLSRAKVRVLDAFSNDSLNNESYRSAAEMGRALENSDDVLFSREGKDASMEEIDKKIAAAQAKYNKNKTPLTEGNLLDLLRKKEALINNQIKPTQETKPKQEDDYRDPHKAPTVEEGAQGNDLTKVYPDDIYSAKAAQYYGDGSQLDKTTIKTVQSWRGKPNAEVTIYRAVPKSAPDAINAGDWVGINRQYAENHGDGPLNGDYKIVSKKVKVSEIYTKGDSIQEWGYHPSNDDVKFSRASNATNEQDDLSHVGTVAERVNAIIQKSAATPAPIEAVVKAAVKLAQFDKVTSAIYDGAGFILDRFTPETVKAGFVSDYGVPEAVIDRRTTLSAHMNVQTRKAGKLIDQLASLTREESRVAYEWMNNSNPEALKHFEEQLPPESVAVLADVKKMIDDLSKEAISLGQLSKEAYDKNSMEYLRRSYEKHIVGIDKKEQKARTRALSILGDQYKGRGLVELASMKQIQNLAPDWWNRKLVDGKADKQLKGEKFIRLERHAPSGEGTIPLEGIGDKQQGKLQEIVYYPAGEAIPAKYAEWTEAGTFEVRDTKGGDAVLWRDFTKQEREKMGEIDEARFAIAKTLHGMIHDVEVGRYLEWVNRKYGLTHKEQVPGEIINAHELTLTTFGAVYKPGDWVKVPKTEIGETGVYKYGALAGKFIPGPIWNDVRQIGTGSFMPFGPTYSAILRLWKTSKTALSTGVHMNNIMSNFVMADWHDVSAGHIHKALRILLASHDREGTGIIGKAGNAAARLGIVDREAAKEILGRYQDSGGNIGTYASKELQNEQIQPLLDAIEREMAENGDSPTAQVGVMHALQFLRHGEVSAAYQAAIGSKGAKAIGNEAKNLIDLYQSEDDVFRLAAWLKAKEDGATDIEAGKKSRKSFLDYNINAPWVAAMRSTAFPFIAFSYRAIPMLAETAAKRPWKLLKLAAIAGGLNALSYALIGGDEDDERRYLPEEKAGRVWGMVPKLIRMPFDTDGQPVFLDIRRFIPVGDVFDLGQGHSAVPVPPSMMPGGPMMLLFEAILNKSAFTAKDISLETDTTFERLMKTGDYMYKAVAPNIAFLPGTYSYENITNAGKGKTDTFGRELSVNQALLNSVGIKVGSYGADTLRYNAGKKLEGELREIDANIHGLSREYSKKGLTYDEFIEKATKQQDKKKAIIEKYRAK